MTEVVNLTCSNITYGAVHQIFERWQKEAKLKDAANVTFFSITAKIFKDLKVTCIKLEDPLNFVFAVIVFPKKVRIL